MDQTLLFVFNILVLILSVVVHEVSHGLMANKLGDPTAKNLGRLSFNPLKHLDFMGSFIVPMISYLLGGFIFGWAKPVPYNPYNLKNQKWGPAAVAAVGPASNFILAIIGGIVLRFLYFYLPFNAVFLISIIVFVNIILGVFNLIPIPPLDGSKILMAVLPYRYERQIAMLEQYGFFLVLVFIFFFLPLIDPVFPALFELFTGMPFVF